MAQLKSTNVLGNLSVTGDIKGQLNGTVYINDTTPSSAASYNLLYAENKSGFQSIRANNDLYYHDSGTWSSLNIGSSSNKGILTLHNNGNYVDLVPATLTGHMTITVPNANGTLALTSQIPTTLKNPTSLTIQGNGTTLGTYDGGTAKTINITYSNVGAAAASHTHNYAGSSSAGGSATTANALTIFDAKTKETNATRKEGLLKYIQMSSGATTYDITPSDDWWSVIRTQHGGYDVGYWQEMAYAFHTDEIKFRRNKNGTKSAWKTIAFTDSDITGNAATASKVKNSLTVKGNGKQSFTYDGSAAKTLNIKAGTSVTVTSDTSGNITIASTDTKVTQEVQTASSYTNWRPLVIGSSNSGTEGFTPSTTTDKTFVFNTLSVQPSTGTIRAKVFKIDNDVKFVYNSDDKCLDVIFG